MVWCKRTTLVALVTLHHSMLKFGKIVPINNMCITTITSMFFEKNFFTQGKKLSKNVYFI